jgi:hypothetical protein
VDVMIAPNAGVISMNKIIVLTFCIAAAMAQ